MFSKKTNRPVRGKFSGVIFITYDIIKDKDDAELDWKNPAWRLKWICEGRPTEEPKHEECKETAVSIRITRPTRLIARSTKTNTCQEEAFYQDSKYAKKDGTSTSKRGRKDWESAEYIKHHRILLLKDEMMDKDGKTSIVSGRYIRVLVNGMVNGYPIYRNEKNNNIVMWYCREWMCHVDGWVIGEWFDELKEENGKKVLKDESRSTYVMKIPKSNPKYEKYADTNHYKIWMHYKQIGGTGVDGPPCACSEEFEHRDPFDKPHRWFGRTDETNEWDRWQVIAVGQNNLLPLFEEEKDFYHHFSVKFICMGMTTQAPPLPECDDDQFINVHLKDVDDKNKIKRGKELDGMYMIQYGIGPADKEGKRPLDHRNGFPYYELKKGADS